MTDRPFINKARKDQTTRANLQRRSEKAETAEPASNGIKSREQATKPALKRKAGDEHATKRSRKRTKRTKPSSSPSLLHQGPAEIREMIFNLCDMSWNGRSPAIIRALRQDPQLHAEAMRVFVKKENMFALNRRNGWSFHEMSVETILTIKKLKIEIQ